MKIAVHNFILMIILLLFCNFRGTGGKLLCSNSMFTALGRTVTSLDM